LFTCAVKDSIDSVELAVYLALTEEPMGRKTAVSDGSKRIIARNRRATHDYHILDTWEAGMVLTGTEVKALRHGKASIKEAFARVRNGEVFLESMTITPYEHGNRYNHDPRRPRKLLLHRKEIARMIGAVERQGLTLIPLDLYFRDGHAKVTLALGKGKKQHDRRQDLKRRVAEREMSRAASRKLRA
jgi:SsrA-binding protein